MSEIFEIFRNMFQYIMGLLSQSPPEQIGQKKIKNATLEKDIQQSNDNSKSKSNQKIKIMDSKKNSKSNQKAEAGLNHAKDSTKRTTTPTASKSSSSKSNNSSKK